MIDVDNIEKTNINGIWQTKQKFLFFCDAENPYSENLKTKVTGFITACESFKITRESAEINFLDKLKAAETFNYTNDELIPAVNEYFGYYKTNSKK